MKICTLRAIMSKPKVKQTSITSFFGGAPAKFEPKIEPPTSPVAHEPPQETQFCFQDFAEPQPIYQPVRNQMPMCIISNDDYNRKYIYYSTKNFDTDNDDECTDLEDI